MIKVLVALDGCLIWQKIRGCAVENLDRYNCSQKENFSLLFMAIFDADRQLLCFNISCTPCTHDFRTWQSTPVDKDISKEKLRYPFLHHL